MLKLFSSFLMLCLIIGSIQWAGSSVYSTVKITQNLSPSEQLLVESGNKFGFKLFKKIVEEEKNKNVFISPLSISMALGMVYNGANGTTKDAIQETLELTGLSFQEVNESYKTLINSVTRLDSKVLFKIANSIWYRTELSLVKEFINLNKVYYNAQVKGLDFNDPNALKLINGWVSDATGGKIKEIVDTIDPLTVMFLINAIYFKGNWAFEFEKTLTEDDFFNLSDESKKPSKMMTQNGLFDYFETENFQAIDLPYEDDKFSMMVLLPRPGKSVDLLVAEFNQLSWGQWLNRFSEQQGTLQLPKFTLEYELTLNDILKALGMSIAFDPSRADFTPMNKGAERLYINKVKHKTFIEVNEEGTEAAAVTSVEMVLASLGPYPFFIMRVDRPFLFVIRENHSQSILFMGKIVEPLLK